MDIKQKVKTMTLEEYIGQKIMLGFRYWDPNSSSKKDMTAPDKIVGGLITNNHIVGGIPTGKLTPKGKLPVNVWNDYDVKTNTGKIVFPRGFGLKLVISQE